ncbi:MAG TPA: hypothetical protein VMY15_05275 [Candidatus Latescibacteria bacterium]|nr:hypothetical protein [Candidatus Latescibacterota bacterium]
MFFLLAALLLSPLVAPGRVPEGSRLRDILPTEGLIGSSVVAIRDQAALNAHYYLADETILGFGKNTEAVFARYMAGPGEALLLVISYRSEEDARHIYEKFGQDFFSKTFDGTSSRTLEKLETGDYAAAAVARSVLIVILEAPDRKSCEQLIKRVEEKARLLF